jgi:GNAT superfamily N-acetyltransferase
LCIRAGRPRSSRAILLYGDLQLMQFRIDYALPEDAPVVAQMVGELLREIMTLVETKTFGFHQEEAETRARSWIVDGKYSVVLARDRVQPEPLGFLALYESFALYTEGTYGTIPEFYVRPAHRSKGIGAALMGGAIRSSHFGATYGPTLVAWNQNGGFRLTRYRRRLH